MESPHEFCFSAVASKRYIANAAGLWANVREVHPGVPLVVLAIDEATYEVFQEADRPDLHVVSAAEAWGSEYWENMRGRMTVPERAYASKSALVHWIVASGFAKATLLLDSDSVIVAEIEDLIRDCAAHDLLLVPTRHDIRSWRRSQRAGLFSAGVVGLSQSGLLFAAAWKAMCFGQCTVVPIDGIYNEQKYLEYLIGHANTKIVRDPGVNLSATILQGVAPEKGEDGRWRTSDGSPVRLFHFSRTTDPEFELSVLKTDYDRSALEELGRTEFLPQAPSDSGRSRDGAKVGFRLGSLYACSQAATVRFFRRVWNLQRALSVGNGSPGRRIRIAFQERDALEKQMWDKVGDVWQRD